MDAVERSKRLAFVKEQLAMYGGKKVVHADYHFISCPFHNEKTPSARIFHYPDSNSPGSMKCYGCGASKPWDELAPVIGLLPYKRGKPKDEYAMMSLSSVERLVEYDESSLKKERMRFKKLKAGQVWRHIKTDLLMRFEAKQCKVWSEEYQAWGATMMYLPCHINGELVGYIKARLEKHDTKPSYINASGRWSKTHGLFPFDYAVKVMKRKKSSTMILVEGPRDALRLLQMGIPAMCILGTQSFSQNKAKLLELAGITRVVLFFDGDEAGIKATEKVKPIVESMLAVRVLKLWSMKGSPWKKVKDHPKPKDEAKRLGLSLWDPGSVPKEILMKVKEKYYA